MIEKSITRITDWHHKACQFSYPILTQIMNYFSSSQLIIAFYIGKNINITMTSQIDMRPACDRRAPARFYLSHRLLWVCEKELSHMGKVKENPDLVCENIKIYHE